MISSTLNNRGYEQLRENEIKFDPFDEIPIEKRWFPDQEQLNQKEYDCLLPPLVEKIRREIYKWRGQVYKGTSQTTKSLLCHWFLETEGRELRYFFAQREAVETIIYLYEIIKIRDKYGLAAFDSSGKLKVEEFEENWTRYCIKMATGTGKTKVLSLLLAWSYFHKLYEPGSMMSKNFLVVAPNIIVLERLKRDFDNLCIFRNDPVIPENGYDGRNWKRDFCPELHIQDDIGQISQNGNIFLTNIHRVYMNETLPTRETYWLGEKPVPNADRSGGMDLGKIIRSKQIHDLVVFNDEAHHIHSKNLQWFEGIRDINSGLLQRTGKGISAQIDLTATPKHNNGEIFAQTVSDFPLVEAIKCNIVKKPVLPDKESRDKLDVRQSDDAGEKYSDFIHLGYIEWKKHFDSLKGKKTPVLFVMAEDTREAEQIALHLEKNYQVMKNRVLVIHTNKTGEIDEKRSEKELQVLRNAANSVDSSNSPYLAVVSVMVLREGWDVRNVTAIVGLRPFKAKSQILPEQAIGRGLRKMFDLQTVEELVVVGNPPFIEFVESLKSEGVRLGYRTMGEKSDETGAPLIIELDRANLDKDLEKMDIVLPKLGSKYRWDPECIFSIDVDAIAFKPLKLDALMRNDPKEIQFIDILGSWHHKIEFKPELVNFSNIIGFFTSAILKEARMPSGFNELYPKVEHFAKNRLFGKTTEIDDPVFLMNFTRPEVSKTIFDTFRAEIERLTLKQVENPRVDQGGHSQLDFEPIAVSSQRYVRSKKCLQNMVVGNQLELEFAAFLDRCQDVVSFARIYERRSRFRLDYATESGKIQNYYPDFVAKTKDGFVYIAETKGIVDEDAKRKRARLEQWCKDANKSAGKESYRSLFIRQAEWEKFRETLKKIEEANKIFGNMEN